MKYFTAIFIFLIIDLSISHAKSFRVNQIPNGSKNSCANCHVNPNGGGPRNNFGQLVEAITGSNNIAFWSFQLASLDADGDGFSNGEELQDPTGTWTVNSPAPGDISLVTKPGDPTDFPPITSVEDLAVLPIEYKLENNYPNPFNPSTTINFSIAENNYVTIEIFNALGENVKTLVNENFSLGSYTVNWNSDDDFGTPVKSGVYYYRIVAGNFVETKRMILLK